MKDQLPATASKATATKGFIILSTPKLYFYYLFYGLGFWFI